VIESEWTRLLTTGEQEAASSFPAMGTKLIDVRVLLQAKKSKRMINT
jgi:hypothetical protein